MSATFRRRVIFRPGYNYLHETGPNRRGQHGMEIAFVLIGPEGAVQFTFGTMWTPLGEVDKGSRDPVHVDYQQRDQWGAFGLVRPPTGHDLGHHWRTPTYHREEAYGQCAFLGAECYYDGSGLRADKVLVDFIKSGEPAVWRTLIEEYRRCRDNAAEVAAGGAS